MGIEACTLRLLCDARRRGALFTETLTLGRQHLSVRPAELDEARRLMRRPLLGMYQRWRRDSFRNTAHYRRWKA